MEQFYTESEKVASNLNFISHPDVRQLRQDSKSAHLPKNSSGKIEFSRGIASAVIAICQSLCIAGRLPERCHRATNYKMIGSKRNSARQQGQVTGSTGLNRRASILILLLILFMLFQFEQ